MKHCCALVLVLVMFVAIGCGNKSETAGKGDASETPQASVVMPENYSLSGTWTGEYKSKTVTIIFDSPDTAGRFELDGLAEPIPFKVEKELPSKNRINAVIAPEYKFIKAFAPKTLKPGHDNMTLKLKYTGENEFAMYNGLFVQDGKLALDDGPMTLKKK